MIIPLAIPIDGRLINLSQIVEIRVHNAGACDECDETHIVGAAAACTVYFADGRSEVFSSKASQILNAEMHFALNAYRSLQIESTRTIVSPNGEPPSRLM